MLPAVGTTISSHLATKRWLPIWRLRVGYSPLPQRSSASAVLVADSSAGLRTVVAAPSAGLPDRPCWSRPGRERCGNGVPCRRQLNTVHGAAAASGDHSQKSLAGASRFGALGRKVSDGHWAVWCSVSCSAASRARIGRRSCSARRGGSGPAALANGLRMMGFRGGRRYGAADGASRRLAAASWPQAPPVRHQLRDHRRAPRGAARRAAMSTPENSRPRIPRSTTTEIRMCHERPGSMRPSAAAAGSSLSRVSNQ
jgi:hypothetical protein